MKQLAILIVNYCTPDLTVDCVRSLYANKDDLPPGTQVVVVDGCSPDDSVPVIRSAIEYHQWADFVTLLPLEVNGGFAYANNRGMQAATSHAGKPRFILLLNPDTVVRPGAVSKLLEFMEAHPHAGIAGSRLEDPDGTPQSCAFRFHSVIAEFEATIRLGLVSRMFRHRRVSPPVSNTLVRIDWVSGASMLIRGEVFDEIGALDEAYFMYYEEADFCLRAARAGWECWHVPESRVVHLVGQASGVTIRNAVPGRRPAYWFKSRRRYFVKNHGWLYAVLADAAWVSGHSLWRLHRALQNKPDNDPPMLLRDFMRHSVLACRAYRRSMRISHGEIAAQSDEPGKPQEPAPDMPAQGVVVIGRNEGERLRRCLQSLHPEKTTIVYVNSGSDDGSVAHAASFGCEVVNLDTARPFTAARARNAGLDRLLAIHSDCELVQFVDGDCEVVDGWMETAAAFMDQNREYAVACGRRYERYPTASAYNRLCDLEWNTPIGEAESCGGDALMRVKALRDVGGFDGTLIAGEEPELCSRLRHAGWRVMRLDREMTVHDANMLRFGQWWRRSTRTGWAFVSGASVTGRLNKRDWMREAVRPWFWCFGLPVASLVLAIFAGWWGLLPLFAYPLTVCRAALTAALRGASLSTALLFGVLCLLGKPAELQGQFIWIRDQLRGSAPRLVEYKRHG